MPVTLPPPLWVTPVIRLQASDENQILQRLYERDELLRQELLILGGVREDLFQQFGRLDDVERRWRRLNQTINQIVATFYADINEDGATDWDGSVDFFMRLIRDLKSALTSVEELTEQIIRWQDIRSLLTPEVVRINQIADLDRLVRLKLQYIYGRWDVDDQDDILSVGGTLPLAQWDVGVDILTATISTTPGISPGITPQVQSAGAFNGALAGIDNDPGPTPYIQVDLTQPVFGATYTMAVAQAFIDTPSLTKVLLFRCGWDTAPNPGDIMHFEMVGLGQSFSISDIIIPEIGPIDPITGAVGRTISFRIHGNDKSIEQL